MKWYQLIAGGSIVASIILLAFEVSVPIAPVGTLIGGLALAGFVSIFEKNGN